MVGSKGVARVSRRVSFLPRVLGRALSWRVSCCVVWSMCDVGVLFDDRQLSAALCSPTTPADCQNREIVNGMTSKRDRDRQKTEMVLNPPLQTLAVSPFHAAAWSKSRTRKINVHRKIKMDSLVLAHLSCAHGGAVCIGCKSSEGVSTTTSIMFTLPPQHTQLSPP